MGTRKGRRIAIVTTIAVIVIAAPCHDIRHFSARNSAIVPAEDFQCDRRRDEANLRPSLLALGSPRVQDTRSRLAGRALDE